MELAVESDVPIVYTATNAGWKNPMESNVAGYAVIAPSGASHSGWRQGAGTSQCGQLWNQGQMAAMHEVQGKGKGNTLNLSRFCNGPKAIVSRYNQFATPYGIICFK